MPAKLGETDSQARILYPTELSSGQGTRMASDIYSDIQFLSLDTTALIVDGLPNSCPSSLGCEVIDCESSVAKRL